MTIPDVPQINQANIDSIKEDDAFENGDIYDEDEGRYLATVDLKSGGEHITLPARLSLYMHGYWYIFTPVGRYKQEDEPKEETQS